MHRIFLKLFFLSFFIYGCAVKVKPPNEIRLHKLAKILQSMSTTISSKEANKLAKDIFQKTQSLARDFKMTYPPQYNNFLVNIGFKKKGLCYHWADDLYVYFKQKTYPSFEFHLIGANIGKYWTEHNAMAITAKGMTVHSGVVTDPWRNSGNLYFSKIKSDSKYIWKHRPKREY